ncbi:MAG TPA: PrsW family intramembrane metalloprotease [Anaerolineae bacterium]|nr:PrsW family intramembrane metalloprotease [Anaerolineae bacterium]
MTSRKSSLDRLFPIFALTGTIFSLLIAIGSAVNGFYHLSNGRSDQAALVAWSTMAFAILFLAGIPGAYWSLKALRGKSLPLKKPSTRWAMVLVIIPLGICLGSASIFGFSNPSIFQAIGYVLAITTVVFTVVLILRWIGPPLSPRRVWGHFLIGLYGIPVITLIGELLLFIPSLLLLGTGLMLSSEGQALLELLTNSVYIDPAVLNESMQNLIMEPWVIAVIFVNLAILVPLAEEVIKTMAIWPLLRRKITPAQGFLGGALAGAGVALFEALLISEPGETWFMILIGRSGTTLMHVFTAGITNWGLVGAIQDRKWKRFTLTFLAAVALHGIWNASSLGAGLAGQVILMEPEGPAVAYAAAVACAGSLAMLAMTVLTLVGIPWLARNLVRAESETI